MTSGVSFTRHLARATRGVVKEREPLARHVTWRMGGPADVLVEPADEEDLAAILALCRQEAVPVLLLAGGSNLLCDDQGLRGVAVRLSGAPGHGLARMQLQGGRIIAGAGCAMPELARLAARHGLSGLEHASNIPGSLGGCVAMNGGSMRRSISENCARVVALTPHGERVEFKPEDCGFGYRKSLFQQNGCLVTSVELELRPDEPAAILRRIREDMAERKRKFPLDLPSCGSVFKSHEALYKEFGPPGKVIEDSGLKGQRRGDLQVSERHANFIVNLGQGRAKDAMALVAHVREKVRERTGVAMECEVRFAAADGRVAPLHEFL